MYHDIGNGMMISLMFLLRESILGLGGYESSRQCFFFFIFCEVCWLATNIVSACMGASYNITRFSYSILVDIGLFTTYDHIIILNLFILVIYWYHCDMYNWQFCWMPLPIPYFYTFIYPTLVCIGVIYT